MMTAEPLHPLDPRRKEKAVEKPARHAGKKSAGAGRTAGERSKKAAAHRPGSKSRPTSRRSKKPTGLGPPPGMVRIQKILAQAGYASRRASEELVEEGRVSVNGKVKTSLPIFVDPESDQIAIDGRSIRTQAEKLIHILLNKPKGVVSTNYDPHGRPRVVDLVTPVIQRVFPVGRLDVDSTGLIILTNDGELANLLTHPRYGVIKTYVVEVEGRLEGEDLESLKGGAYLDGKKTSGAGVKVIHRSNSKTILEMRLREGRNREIRRIVARLGRKVRGLRRVAIGPLTDRGVKTGKYRFLTSTEIEALRRAAVPEK